MTFAQPHFADPGWLWLAGLGPLFLVVLQLYAARQRRKQLAHIASPEFMRQLTRSHSPARRWIKHGVLVVTLALMGLALARPQWGTREIVTENLSEDIVFAIDCSQSMLVEDVSPNRLQRAKLAVQDFVRRHANGRVGLVAFSGQAFLQCPLTFDHGAFEEALTALDQNTIPVPGTDVGRALDESARALEKMDRKKVVVLITDGEDLEKTGVKMATDLAKSNVVVFTVGVGTSLGGEVVVRNDRGQMQPLRDSKGGVVYSRLDEPTLRAIAQATGGNYESLGPLGEGLTKVQLAVAAKEFSGGAPSQKFGVDRFHVPVALALVLLVVESLMGTRRRQLPQNAAGLVLVFLISCAFNSARAQSNGLLATNDAQLNATNAIVTPAQTEPEPRNAREFYNAGSRRLQERKWMEAESAFQTALAQNDERIWPVALYNLGHVRYSQGAEELKKSPDAAATMKRAAAALERGDAAGEALNEALDSTDIRKMVGAYLNGRGARRELKEAIDLTRRALEAHGVTLQKWQRALDDFKSSLELNPNDADAKRNIEIIEEQIAKLIDRMNRMAMMAQMMGQQRQALGELMRQLRGKIPAPNAPPGAAEDFDAEEDDDDRPRGPRPGEEEARGRDGNEQQQLSPEEAGWLLESLKLNGERRLPMGPGNQEKPKDRKGKTW